ncbi:uncharacterized protein METZ01_LOCUS74141 [marine metagenome]|uniref:Amidase domain-containing protein n=1 Tax=marine metagenome TaxID=408172 RepID=A0A381U200_9ZZZZ
MTKLHNMTISEASDEIRKKNVSPVELLESFLKRSESLEGDLNVWVTMDPELAMKSAKVCESEITLGRYKGPLHGIPIGVKDIYYTRDMKTTCCSPIFKDFESGYDSEPVKLLREAGAVIMGKTVTTQFACGDPPPTRNPWNLRRTPGGSSSGSAVGIAAGYFPASLGSQTAGSVLRPAAYNGVVGFKPTHGLVSRFGVYPVALSLDTMGWFTKNVQDSATMLQCMAGYDDRDEGSVFSEIPRYSDAFLENKAPKIGLVEQYYLDEADDETVSSIHALADKLSNAGAEVSKVSLDIDFEQILAAHRVIMTVEGAFTHKCNFAARPEDYLPEVRKIIETGNKTSAVSYVSARNAQRELKSAVERVLEGYDLLLSPTAVSGAPTPETTGQPVFQAPWTMAGIPSISLPYSLDVEGMPLGAQLAGKFLGESSLLATAAWVENIVEFRKVPNIS